MSRRTLARRVAGILSVAAIVAPTLPGAAFAAPQPAAPTAVAPAARPAPEQVRGQAGPRSETKLRDGHLRGAVDRHDAGQAPGSDVIVRDGKVLVEVIDRGNRAAARREITKLGGTITGGAGGHLTEALVPFDSLVDLQAAVAVADLRVPSVSVPLYVPEDEAPPTIAATGQEIAKTNADDWQAAGYLGAGVKVGIIDFFSSSVWSAAQTAGEVPVPAGTFCQYGGVACGIYGTTSKHGTAVAEIVHELAPSAQIYIATAGTAADHQAAVNYFVSQGVDIITRSLTAQYDGKGDGTGAIDDVVASAVAQGITWFNSAGNSAGSSGTFSGSYWRGSWVDADNDGWLEWGGSGDELLDLPCIGGGRYVNGLRWSDWAANRTDYDLYLFENLGDPVGSAKEVSDDDQQSGASPIELLNGPCTNTDYAAVKLYNAGGGTAGDVLELQVNGTGVEYWSNPYSAAVPASDSASAGALSIGAVDPAAGTTIASYSSRGPTNDGRTKPDISAAACVTSFSYSPSCFNGTSAASPVAAGAAALVLGAGLTPTPAALKTYLLTNAFVDRGTAGTDNTYGVGELVLPAPPSAICPPDDAYEDNDSIGTATAITSGVGLLGIACPNDQDLYRINATAGDTLSVDLTFTHAGGNLDMTLRDGGGGILATSAGTTNAEAIDYAVPSTATYYVQVYGTPFATTDNTYGLVATVTAPPVTPVAAFSAVPTSGYAPLHVQLTDESTNSPTSWSWEITDALRPGSPVVFTSSARNPGVNLAEGFYTVKLTATNTAGSDSEEKASYLRVDAPNDNFSDARTIALGGSGGPVTSQWTDTATLEKDEPDPEAQCIAQGNDPSVDNTVWYRIHPTKDALVTIGTMGDGSDSSFDTVLEVGTGSGVTTFDTLACNDDVSDTISQSRVQNVALHAGVDYHVRVSGRTGDPGLVRLYYFGKEDSAAPTVKLSLPTLAAGAMSSNSFPVRLAWTASDGSGVGIDHYLLRRRSCSTSTNACSATWTTIVPSLPAGTLSKVVYSPSGYYEYSVVAYDKLGHAASSPARLRTSVYQNTSTSISLSSGWHRAQASTSAYGGSFAWGTSGRAKLTVPKGTRQVAWVAQVNSAFGTARVYVDGALVATIDLRAGTAAWRKLVSVRTVSTTKAHTIEIRWRSGRINVDAIVAAR